MVKLTIPWVEDMGVKTSSMPSLQQSGRTSVTIRSWGFVGKVLVQHEYDRDRSRRLGDEAEN